MIHLGIGNGRTSYDVERVQVVAASNGVFFRVTTTSQEINPSTYAPIRESARRSENRWHIDGVSFNLSCRNAQFHITQRRPVLLTQLVIDLYMPLNQAIDVSFQHYTPSDGPFDTVFNENAAIAERQTGAFPMSASPTGRHNAHRPVAVANIPRQMRELVSNDLVNMDTIAVDATTLNAPSNISVVPAITETPPPPPEAKFLRRFDRLVPDEEIGE